MARSKRKIPPVTPEDPRLPLDETLPRGELHCPAPSRMDPDGGWVGNPVEHINPEQKKERR